MSTKKKPSPKYVRAVNKAKNNPTPRYSGARFGMDLKMVREREAVVSCGDAESALKGQGRRLWTAKRRRKVAAELRERLND